MLQVLTAAMDVGRVVGGRLMEGQGTPSERESVGMVLLASAAVALNANANIEKLPMVLGEIERQSIQMLEVITRMSEKRKAAGA